MKYLILITTVASYFVMPKPTLAAELPTHVFVSEVNWAGSQNSNADEWLELTNPLEEAIELSGWSIEGAATSGGTLTIPNGATIEPHSMYLIANYDAAESTLNAEPDLVTTELALSNSGLGLVLRDGSGAEIDRVGDGGSPSAGFSGTGGLGFGSMIWSIDGWSSASVSSGFDAEVLQFGTPGAPETEIVTQEVEIDSTDEATTEQMDAVETPSIQAEESSEIDPSVTPIAQESVDTPTENEEEVAPAEEETVEEFAITEMEEEEIVPLGDADPPKSYAAGVILINEIVSDPASGNEWVELLNVSDEMIELEGWRLEEGSGSGVEFSGTLAAGDFATAEFANRLNNDGDILTLSDPSGNTIDQVSYGTWAQAVVEAAEDPNALARDDEEVWQITTQPTRGSTNVIVEKQQEWSAGTASTADSSVVVTEETALPESPTTLRIVEVMPNPTGSDEIEYIVIENFGETAVDLEGWIIADTAKKFELTGILGSQLLLTLPRSATGITLNNTGETISLMAPSGETIDLLSYEKSKENEVARDENTTNTIAVVDPTMEYKNVASDQMAADPVATLVNANEEGETAQTSKITQSRTTTSSRIETVTGAVIAPPGLYGSQIFYIDGLQIYQYRGDFPVLALGDLVHVRGTPSTAYGEERIKLATADDVEVIGETVVEPQTYEIAALNDDAVGTLVKVVGTVTDPLADRFTLEQSGATVLVVLKEATQLSATSMSPGETYEVTGVLTRYNDELRLLPRGDVDIVVQTFAPLSAASHVVIQESPHVPWGVLLLVGAGATLVLEAWRHRKQKNLKPSLA